jgi:hypothetical protein
MGRLSITRGKFVRESFGTNAIDRSNIITVAKKEYKKREREREKEREREHKRERERERERDGRSKALHTWMRWKHFVLRLPTLVRTMRQL